MNQEDNGLKNTYTLLNKFECCEKVMVTVIVHSKVACVMSVEEYNRIIKTERKYRKQDVSKVA